MQTDDIEESEFVLRYKGDNVESVGKITYIIETNSSTSRVTGAKLTNGGILQGKGDFCTGCVFVHEDAEVVFTIEWNGKIEKIMLEKD